MHSAQIVQKDNAKFNVTNQRRNVRKNARQLVKTLKQRANKNVKQLNARMLKQHADKNARLNAKKLKQHASKDAKIARQLAKLVKKQRRNKIEFIALENMTLRANEVRSVVFFLVHWLWASDCWPFNVAFQTISSLHTFIGHLEFKKTVAPLR